MRFGVFYELQLPRPWTEQSEYELFQQALDQIELADRLGYDYVWEVEHHFLEEYSHSAAPEVFLGAASQRTSRIRLGHGIVQLVTNHPARVAERIATLDLVSGGRVEMGIGEGSTPTELHGFGQRMRDKRGIWEEAVQAIIPMFTESGTEFHGKHWDMPLRNVIPKPMQKPHPPLWVACSNIQTIEMAGQRGMGALGFQFVTPEAAEAWVNRYYRAITTELDRLADYRINPNVAVVCGFACAETDELAQEQAQGWTFFLFALRHYSKHGFVEPGAVNMWELYQEWRTTPEAQEVLSSGLIGSPDTIRRTLREYEAAHVDQIILLNQAGKATHEDICSGLELFAAEVMPEFQERDVEQQAWKRDVLAGATTLEHIDTNPYRLYLIQPKEHLAYLESVQGKREGAQSPA